MVVVFYGMAYPSSQSTTSIVDHVLSLLVFASYKQKSINERRTQVTAIRCICRAEQYFLFTFRTYNICVVYAFFFYGYVDVAFKMSGIVYETTYDIVTVVKFLHEEYYCCFDSKAVIFKKYER